MSNVNQRTHRTDVNMKNVFNNVYEHLNTKRGAADTSLFNALNREDIHSIILNHGVWWIEKNSLSTGLTDAQHETLKRIMQQLYNASWLYDVVPPHQKKHQSNCLKTGIMGRHWS